jgi:hypothetical protein
MNSKLEWFSLHNRRAGDCLIGLFQRVKYFIALLRAFYWCRRSLCQPPLPPMHCVRKTWCAMGELSHSTAIAESSAYHHVFSRHHSSKKQQQQSKRFALEHKRHGHAVERMIQHAVREIVRRFQDGSANAW